MNFSSILSFSSIPESRGVEARLSGSYLSRFGDIAALARASIPVLASQRDCTAVWKERLESTVVAMSWHPFPGLESWLVLLDDDEFGKEMKWFLPRALVALVDFKLILMAVEASMDYLLSRGSMPISGPPRPLPLVTPGRIHSHNFCFSFNGEMLVPLGFPPLTDLAEHFSRETSLNNPFLLAMNLEKDSGEDVLLGWEVAQGIEVFLAPDKDQYLEGPTVSAQTSWVLGDGAANAIRRSVHLHLLALKGMVSP